MDDALFVCGVERLRDLTRYLEGFGSRQRAPGLQPFGERLAFNQLQHERAKIAVVLDVIDGSNIRVVDRGEDARFALESLQSVGIGRESRRQNLDGHFAAEPRVKRPVHLAHAAGA